MTDSSGQSSRTGMRKEQVDEFEIVQDQLDRFRAEIQLLAKSKPNDSINTFKLGLLNKLLERSNALLGTGYVAVVGFTVFDQVQMPTNSDALLVVSQYLGALEKLRADNIELQMGSWFWVVDGAISKIRTMGPEKLVKK